MQACEGCTTQPLRIINTLTWDAACDCELSGTQSDYCDAVFPTSCAEVLKADGEVHVALCNGQGGTPFDNPIREWHNSWQAVAMAAEAGLILGEIRPFDRDRYQGYKCTGYR